MILAKGEQPFKTPGAAASAAVLRKITAKTYKIEPYKNGFAILMNDEDMQKITAPTIKMSKPWDANENRWAQDAFRTGKNKKGFRLCFCRNDEVESMLDKGYRCAKADEWGSHSRQPDGSLIRDGMIGMELPEQDALDRDAFLSYQTQLRTKQNKDDIKVEINTIGKECGEESIHSEAAEHSV